MPWTRAASAVAVILAACTEEAILSPPVRAGAATVVVAFIDAAGTVKHPTAYDAARAWTIRASHNETVGVVVLYYDRPLSALGLTAGTVDRTPDAPCTRLAPDESWLAETFDGPFSPTAMPPELANILVPDGEARCGRCRRYEETRLDVPGRRRRLEAAAPVSDGSVFALGDAGELFAIDHNGVERMTGCPAERYESMVGFADDHYYLATYDGRVHEVHIVPRERSCRLIAERATATTRTIEWMGTPPDGSELFALDVAGRVHHGVGQGPLEQILEVAINELRFTREGGVNRAGLAWLRPGAFVVSGSYPQAVWWADGRVQRVAEIITRQRDDSVSEIEVIDGHVYVGDGTGQIVRFGPDGEGGELLPGSPLYEIVGSIVADKDGLVVTTSGGIIATYYPSVGWCPIHLLTGASDRGKHAFRDKAGDIFIADMIGNESSQAQVVWLRGLD